ncbi:hypothetical protein J6590_104085 [Homalodisca vitripennis]|nr:hypothetical protein J6590_104085 [Homalodisca vitripennis]
MSRELFHVGNSQIRESSGRIEVALRINSLSGRSAGTSEPIIVRAVSHTGLTLDCGSAPGRLGSLNIARSCRGVRRGRHECEDVRNVMSSLIRRNSRRSIRR